MSRAAYLVSGFLVLLAALALFVLQQHVASGPLVMAATEASAPAAAPRAFTAEEDAYAAALWPTHREIVEPSGVALVFAGIYFATEDHDQHRLVATVTPLHARFAEALAQARALHPPASLQVMHDHYVGAITDYENASSEMMKLGQDGDPEHLVVAQAMSQRASETLITVGDVLWPGEHKPN